MTDEAEDTTPDRPTATAVSAAFLGLEEKLLRMLSENHNAQMAEIRRGANEVLRKYQDAWAVNLRAFDSEFGRAIGELQGITHRTANRVQEIDAEREVEKRERAKLDDFFDRRLRTLENWHTDEVVAKKQNETGDPCPPPASSSTTNR